MSITPKLILSLVEAELVTVSDKRVIEHIQGLMVSPQMVMRQWDYGETGTKCPCWSVLVHKKSDTGIAYSEFGFGPTYPWGLVKLSGTDNEQSIGMDCGWYPSFVEAYFESFASSDLPIWRIFRRGDTESSETPITPESDWDSTWEQIYKLRESDKTSVYNCNHSVEYQKSEI